ncbi:MAG: hypothetical protein M0Z98_04160, partial [Actinomycetales bacterium]|nr:hypothetical protein [Actinomycetales bacterium]
PSAPAPSAGGPPAPPRLSTVAPSTTAGSLSAGAAPASPSPEPGGPDALASPAAPPGAEATPTSGEAAPARPARPAAGPDEAVDLGPVVTMWPAVLEALKSSSRVAHTLAEGTSPMSRTASTLVVAHPDKSRLDYLRNNKGHLELLRLALLDVLHLDVDVDLVLDPARAAATPPPAPAPVAAPAAPAGPSPRERATAAVAEEKASHVAPVDDVVSADDPDADGDLSGLALVERELGGTVMTEYDNG